MLKIAFYGTLMRGFGAQRALGLEAALRFEGACRIPGVLWDLGPYPGMTEGEGEVAGELFSLEAESTLDALDEFEGNEYERRELSLLDPPEKAWVYVLRNAPQGRPRVQSGCWTSTAGGRRSG
jgi:gamma-glutamylcyclotransferase (GGCT)/AIG2-like uncharacterized protein YtfP